MKKTFKKAVVLLMLFALVLSCTGCVTGEIYGKPIDDMEEADKAQGILFGEKIIGIMQDGTLEELDELGYHAGKEDAETFEEFWAEWEVLRTTYGDITGWGLVENMVYGSEFVFIYEVATENGPIMVSNMFTDEFELVMMDVYETGETALANTVIPEGIVEEDIVLGEDTKYPVSGKLTYPKDAKAGDNLKAVVLVGTDGPSGMDMQVKNLYAYRDIAWGLAEMGIASVRFDKTTNTYADELVMEDCPAELHSVTFEYTDHTVFATEMLRALEYVDAEQVYYVGHAQSAVVFPRADEVADYAGIIMLSSSPRPYYEVVYDQYINYGLVDQDDESIYYLVSRMQAERDYLKDAEYAEVAEDELMKDFIFGRPNAFWKDFLSIDLVSYLKEVQKPVLILQGETDFQFTMDADFAAWQREMEGESYATLKSYEGLNHYFIESEGIFAGHYKEYEMPGRVSADVIQDIGNWVLNEGTLAE